MTTNDGAQRQMTSLRWYFGWQSAQQMTAVGQMTINDAQQMTAEGQMTINDALRANDY